MFLCSQFEKFEMKRNFYFKLHQSWPDTKLGMSKSTPVLPGKKWRYVFMVLKLKFLLNYELLLNKKKKIKEVLILREPFYFIQNNEGRMSRNIMFVYFFQCKLWIHEMFVNNINSVEKKKGKKYILLYFPNLSPDIKITAAPQTSSQKHIYLWSFSYAVSYDCRCWVTLQHNIFLSRNEN